MQLSWQFSNLPNSTGFSPHSVRAKSAVSMSTDLDTDEYDEIEFEGSAIHVPLDEVELDYDIPMNFSVTNDATVNQFFQTMNANIGNNTPPNSTKSTKPKIRASTPYKAINKSKLWLATKH